MAAIVWAALGGAVSGVVLGSTVSGLVTDFKSGAIAFKIGGAAISSGLSGWY